MVFLEQLRVHVGGLILLKTQLFWYGGQGWDGVTGRVCLLMDVPDAPRPARPAIDAHAAVAERAAAAAALILIDGRPQWVWIAPADVELL